MVVQLAAFYAHLGTIAEVKAHVIFRQTALADVACRTSSKFECASVQVAGALNATMLESDRRGLRNYNAVGRTFSICEDLGTFHINTIASNK